MNVSHRTISAKDGRQLRIYEAGQMDGVPVLVQRGTPQCAFPYHRWVEDAQTHGIRLIGYARPGYGGSTVQAGRTVAAAAEDVATISRELGLDRLLVWGVSGGGPHALACAALLPGLVVAAAVLACPAPYPAEGLDYFAGTGATNVALSRAALQGREACARCVEEDLLLRATPESLARSLHSLLCSADEGALATDFADFVFRTIRDGCGETRAGWIDDEIALVRHWGFELSQIQIPVLVMQGEQDLMVPVSHGKWLASRIPKAESRLLPDDGHITLSLRRIPEVQAWLLSKIQHIWSNKAAAVDALIASQLHCVPYGRRATAQCLQVPMHAEEPVEIGDGQTFLVIVQGDRVVDYTWAMMPHIEFVKRSVGRLAEDAWVGTISKIDGELAVISSKTFYGVQMPAPEWVARTVKSVFK